MGCNFTSITNYFEFRCFHIIISSYSDSNFINDNWWDILNIQFFIILDYTNNNKNNKCQYCCTIDFLGDDVDFDSELKAQGLGNILSGMCGSVHNYLSYSNRYQYLIIIIIIIIE